MQSLSCLVLNSFLEGKVKSYTFFSILYSTTTVTTNRQFEGKSLTITLVLFCLVLLDIMDPENNSVFSEEDPPQEVIKVVYRSHHEKQPSSSNNKSHLKKLNKFLAEGLYQVLTKNVGYTLVGTVSYFLTLYLLFPPVMSWIQKHL